VVRSRLQRVLLRLLGGHRLVRRGRLLARYALRRPHEPDFAVFGLFADRPGLFLDVGANAGQSALSFRLFNRSAPILSIEPNIAHERDLRFLRRILRRFDFVICAAGDANGRLTLHVPTYRSVPVTGQGSTRRDVAERARWLRTRLGSRAAGDIGVAEQEVEVRRLDDLRLEPGFVKVDVEGSELPVLRGLADTLRRHRPVLLIERTEEVSALGDFLRELGYEAFVFVARQRRLEPYRGQAAQNLVYVASGAIVPTGRLPGLRLGTTLR
jgi:FkbM family methyltransferase